MEVRLRFEVDGIQVEVVGSDSDDFGTILSKVLEDVRGNMEAFRNILLLRSEEDKKKELPDKVIKSQMDVRVKDFAGRSEVSEDDLKRMIHFGEDAPHLLVKMPGSARAQKQRAGGLILLAVLESCYGRTSVKSSDLKKLLNRSDIDERRLGGALSRVPGLVVPRGSKKGRSYEITVPGREEAYKTLRQLAGNASRPASE